ncbi:MAG TPA: hypothetical protein VM683_08005 [Anaeromyxobacteraceae bacterium]|nr:hypothetical protein [Anaeromyxobacteraceae bacterium]
MRQHALGLYLPLLLLGGAAGLVQALARRSSDPRRRRALDLTWILLLLLGAPAWLFAAAALGWL